jgi:hypothetical protein
MPIESAPDSPNPDPQSAQSEEQMQHNATECDIYPPHPLEAWVNLDQIQIRAIDLIVQGMDDSDVARHLGLHRSTLWRWKTFNEDYRRMNLSQTDPQIAELIAKEAQRQADAGIDRQREPRLRRRDGSGRVGADQQICRGVSRRRYYGGCGLRPDRKPRHRAGQAIFGCKFANVQPHSGANANLAAFMAMMKPGDSFISLNLASGGHLSHGMKLNTSAIFYKPDHYELDPKTEQIDFDSVRAKAKELKPKMILCGYSAYPRTIDFAKFREIADEVGALLMADIAHIAGLVAAGCIHRRSRTPTSSPPPRTKPCAARAAE